MRSSGLQLYSSGFCHSTTHRPADGRAGSRSSTVQPINPTQHRLWMRIKCTLRYCHFDIESKPPFARAKFIFHRFLLFNSSNRSHIHFFDSISMYFFLFRAHLATNATVYENKSNTYFSRLDIGTLHRQCWVWRVHCRHERTPYTNPMKETFSFFFGCHYHSLANILLCRGHPFRLQCYTI